MLSAHDDPEAAATFALADLLAEIEAQPPENTDERAS